MLTPRADRRQRAGPTIEQALQRHSTPSALELRRNSEWLDMLGTAELLGARRAHDGRAACSSATTSPSAARQRADLAARAAVSADAGLGLGEVGADVELGGTDQTFNLLVGRDIQEHLGPAPAGRDDDALLVGTDGAQKMRSRSATTSGVTDSAGRDVRPDDVDPRRGDAPVVPRSLLGTSRRRLDGRSARGGQARARARDRRALPRRGGGARGRGASSTASHVATSRPRRSPSPRSPPTTRRAPAGPARGRLRALALRGAPADRGGRRAAGRRAARTSSTSREPRSTAACCSSGAASCASR